MKHYNHYFQVPFAQFCLFVFVFKMVSLIFEQCCERDIENNVCLQSLKVGKTKLYLKPVGNC